MAGGKADFKHVASYARWRGVEQRSARGKYCTVKSDIDGGREM
jgi:hypothetical protein